MSTPAPAHIRINSLDDLEPALEWLLDHPGRYKEILWPEKLEVTVVIEGPTWDGLVDVRVGHYITNLQKTRDKIARECNLPDTDGRTLVKVRLQRKCTKLDEDLIKWVQGLVEKMSSDQQVIILLAALGVGFAGYTLRKLLAHLNEKQAAQLAHEKHTEDLRHQRELAAQHLETIRIAIEKIDPQKAQRQLVGELQEKDTIRLPGRTDMLTRAEARDLFPRKKTVPPTEVVIDDSFQVVSLGLEDPAKLVLAKGETKFLADLSSKISNAETDAFLAQVKSTLNTGKSLKMPLHVDAKVREKSVTEALIVAIGRDPRANAQDIGELLG